VSKTVLLILAVLLPIVLIVLAGIFSSPWEGIDVAVVGIKAQELGGQVWQPFINLEGDALLFAFAIAGVFGGFVLGYFWRDLFGSKAVPRQSSKAPRGET